MITEFQGTDGATRARFNQAIQEANTDISGKANTADLPATLPNPAALTFTGGSTVSYDGSAAKSVAIPTSLKSPAALTVQNGYGNTPATYDGSTAKTISVPYVTLNTASPTATLAAGALWGVY